jgi:hypothetical protein
MQERKRDNTAFNNFIKVCLVVALFIALLWTIPNWRCCGTGTCLSSVTPQSDVGSEKPRRLGNNITPLDDVEKFTIDDILTPSLVSRGNKGQWINPILTYPESYNSPKTPVVGVNSPKTLWLVLPLFILVLALSFYRGRNN